MSDVDYVGQIKGLIETTMNRFTRYKDGVTGVNEELEGLLLKLQNCIERLNELLARYDDILRESIGLRERLQMAMEDVEGQKRECKAKLKQIYDLFNTAVERLGDDDAELQELQRLSNDLKTEIDDICADIDRRMEEAERSGAEEKVETRSDETKSPSPSVQDRGRGSQQSPREQAAEEESIRRHEEARRRSSYTGSLPGYDQGQGGGWRSPANSIPYGTPVRSVNIKYKNETKNKKKKKKKKRGTRKKKKKQSRRKRRKGKRN